jgi:hypothetical protein
MGFNSGLKGLRAVARSVMTGPATADWPWQRRRIPKIC